MIQEKDNHIKHKFSLSVFFPFYNEEKNITAVIGQAVLVLEKLKDISEYEIIIVDDGSSDHTKIIAEEIVKNNHKIKLISHPKNLGYGRALLSGFGAAKNDYIFFTDGDLQFDMNDIGKILEYIPEYKAVIGYRSPRNDSFARLFNAKIWNLANRVAFGLKVKDIDCAFKVFEKNTIKKLKLLSGGAMLSAEIIIRLQRAGVEIKQVPISHFQRKNGSPTGAKPTVIVRALKEFAWLYLSGELGNKTYIQAMKFICVGLANTLVDIFFYFALTRLISFFSLHIILARTISFSISTLCSFTLNRLWTFEKKDKLHKSEIIKFYASTVIGLVVSIGSMKFFIQTFHFYDLVALLISVIFTFIWNFSASKFWVFKNS